MITETGRVVAVDEDALWVETIQRSSCQSCSAKKGCGQSLVAEWGGKTSFIRVLLEGRPAQDYQHGQLVQIGIAEDLVVKGSLFVYLTPLFGLMGGLLLAGAFTASDPGAIVGGTLGFLMGAGLVRWHSHLSRHNPDVQPVLLDETAPMVWNNP